jgi:hypothetical protein
MAKHLRIKHKIWVKLGEGEMNTCQIHDWIENTDRRGISMQKLVNILSKNPKEFRRTGEVKVKSPVNTYKVYVWGRVKYGELDVNHNDRDSTK